MQRYESPLEHPNGMLITRPDMSNTSIEVTLVAVQMPSTLERCKCHRRNRVGRLADQIFAGSKILILEPPDIRLAEDMVVMRSSYKKKKTFIQTLTIFIQHCLSIPEYPVHRKIISRFALQKNLDAETILLVPVKKMIAVVGGSSTERDSDTIHETNTSLKAYLFLLMRMFLSIFGNRPDEELVLQEENRRNTSTEVVPDRTRTSIPGVCILDRRHPIARITDAIQGERKLHSDFFLPSIAKVVKAPVVVNESYNFLKTGSRYAHVCFVKRL